MKLRKIILGTLVVVGAAVCQVYAADVQRAGEGAAGGVNVNSPGVGVRVNADRSAPGVEIRTPNVGVDVQNQRGAAANADPPPVGAMERRVITDNRPDAWRYKWENNRWWYYGPDNRWLWYSTPGGWTYYSPSGSYTTGYGGVEITPAPAAVAPTPIYPVPSTTYYYGYPGYYYYGRPGVYIGGPAWGVRVGRGRWWW
jgi:hypothetical protein